MTYVVEPQAVTALSHPWQYDTFPVRSVYCVGRNYAAHAREMGFDPDREPPFSSASPPTAVISVAY